MAEPAAEWETSEFFDKVGSWRVSQLMLHGADFLNACALANDLAVDLHRACDLLDAGCDPDMVVHILI